MKTISLPKKFLVEEAEKGKKARVVIEPCYPGYGITLGNALRRVMLNSLPGGAVTAVKIKGVGHEFTTIENISEDIVEIILNLKQLKVKVYSDEPVIMNLKVTGEKKVTAGDIENNSDAEIVDKNLHIATINDKNTTLEMEITVEKGIGYVPTEEREDKKEKPEIGTILIDSIFTPVLSVGLHVEATRVGQKVDYDKIILDIETDGSISPEESVQKASEILVNQFSWIMEGGREDLVEIDLEAPVELPEKEESVEDSIASDEEDDSDEEKEETPKKRGRPKKSEIEE